MEYLPSGTEGNSIELRESVAPTPLEIMARFRVPAAEVRTMMCNGVFLAEEERNTALQDGDTLTVWPAIQGG